MGGWKEIAVDEPEQFYGSRSVQWARLRHRQSNKLLLFVNHRGPLRVNSGGRKGGPQTANKILTAIHDNVEPGDGVILLGDFNAQAGSQTVRALEQYIPRVASGTACGVLITSSASFRWSATLRTSARVEATMMHSPSHLPSEHI